MSFNLDDFEDLLEKYAFEYQEIVNEEGERKYKLIQEIGTFKTLQDMNDWIKWEFEEK